jgi:hypothetical protein
VLSSSDLGHSQVGHLSVPHRVAAAIFGTIEKVPDSSTAPNNLISETIVPISRADFIDVSNDMGHSIVVGPYHCGKVQADVVLANPYQHC